MNLLLLLTERLKSLLNILRPVQVFNRFIRMEPCYVYPSYPFEPQR